jgi:hypothetical protein
MVEPLETLLHDMPFLPTQLALKIAVRITADVVVLLTVIATTTTTSSKLVALQMHWLHDTHLFAEVPSVAHVPRAAHRAQTW